MTHTIRARLFMLFNRVIIEGRVTRNPLYYILIALYYSICFCTRCTKQTTSVMLSRRLRPYPNKKEAIERLCLGMDDKSRKLVKCYCERQSADSFYFSFSELWLWLRTRLFRLPYRFPFGSTVIPDVFVFKNGLVFLPPSVTRQIANGCVVDGGAASGDSSLVFTEFDPKQIYAMEPSVKQREELCAVIADNQKTEMITVVPYGLSDQQEILTITDQYGEQVTIQAITIDSFARDKKISLIKLDIEGAEFAAIRGALETIQRDKPVLLICLYHTPKDLFEIKPLIESTGVAYQFIIRATEVCCAGAGVHLMLIGYPRE